MYAPPPQFPNLTEKNHQVTSPQTGKYNCIAFAVGDEANWWWPSVIGFWPEGAPKEETVEAFVAAFATVGYSVTNNGNLEIGFEKIALFADSNGIPKHAARQLANGAWASKLGADYDISHDLEAVEGPLYGTVVRFLRRPISRSE